MAKATSSAPMATTPSKVASSPAANASSAVAPLTYYIILQGDTVWMEQGTTRPDTNVNPGERRKKILYASTDPAHAQERLAFWQARARGTIPLTVVK
jgi:hypothetical protein